MQISPINNFDRKTMFRGSVKRDVDNYIKYCIMNSTRYHGAEIEAQYKNALKLLREKVKRMHPKTQLKIVKEYNYASGELTSSSTYLCFYNSRMRKQLNNKVCVGRTYNYFPYNEHVSSERFEKIVNDINPEEIDKLFISEMQNNLNKHIKNTRMSTSMLSRINRYTQDVGAKK